MLTYLSAMLTYLSAMKLFIFILLLQATIGAFAGECTVYSESSATDSPTLPVFRPGAHYHGVPISGIHIGGVGRAHVCASAQIHISKHAIEANPMYLYYWIGTEPYSGIAINTLSHHGYRSTGLDLIDTCANVAWTGEGAEVYLYAWTRFAYKNTAAKPVVRVSEQGTRMTALTQVDCG